MFRLQVKRGNTFVNVAGQEKTSDANGELFFADILPGDYRIEETRAPDGYYLTADTLSFTVDENGAVAITAKGDDWEQQEAENLLVVTDYAGTPLPMTGGPGALPFVVGGLLTMAVSLFVGMKSAGGRRHRRRRAS